MTFFWNVKHILLDIWGKIDIYYEVPLCSSAQVRNVAQYKANRAKDYATRQIDELNNFLMSDGRIAPSHSPEDLETLYDLVLEDLMKKGYIK